MKQEKRRTSNVSNDKSLHLLMRMRIFTSSGYKQVDQILLSKHASYCYFPIMYSIPNALAKRIKVKREISRKIWMEKAATVYKFKCIFAVTFFSGCRLYAIRSAGLA